MVKLILTLDSLDQRPLYLQLAAALEQAMADGRLRAGEKLPSIRQLSAQLRVSSITVREALQYLAKANLIESKTGSGNFVCNNYQAADAAAAPKNTRSTEQNAPEAFVGRKLELDPSIEWSLEAKRLNDALNSQAFSPGWNIQAEFDFRPIGHPLPEFVSSTDWKELLQDSSRDFSGTSGKYDDARGLPELREAVADWLNRARGLMCSADEIFITSGAQQCRDLVSRLLVSPGDKVVVQEPASITDIIAYRSQGAKLVHLPQNSEGIDIEQLASCCDIRLIHLIPTANFPTGLTISAEARQKIINWALLDNTYIVEDAFGSDVVWHAGAPAIYRLAKESEARDLVLYHGSFSQLVSPLMRIGFAAIPQKLQQSYFRIKWLSDRHQPLLIQQILLRVLREGLIDKQLLTIREAASRRRQAMLDSLKLWNKEVVRFEPVQAGFQQTVFFTDAVDDVAFCNHLLQQGVGAIPLSPYYLNSAATSGLILNFMAMTPPQITVAAAKIAAAFDLLESR